MFNAEGFPWACPWYHLKNTIFSVGDYPNVPLMGPRGCIAYTPNVALRQLRWTQDKPRDEELGGERLLYAQGDKTRLERIIRAWGSIKRKDEKELGKPRRIATQRYKDWRASRILPQAIPKEIPQEEESSLSKDHLTSLLAVAKAQLALMEDKEEKAKTRILALEHECQKKHMDLENLKNEMADRNSQKKRKATQSESQAIRCKLEDVEGRLRL